MKYRYLGHSGLKVSTMSLGTMTFGGKERFSKLGNNGVKEADEIIRLNEVSAPSLIYPYWHQAKFAKDTFCEGDKALFNGRDI